MSVAVDSLIRQRVTLPASAAGLYRTYVSAKAHGEMTGAPAVVSARPGSEFSALGGALSGMTLAVVPGRQVVQRWRSTQFGKAPDSLLVLTFTDTPRGGCIDLIHLGVPPVDYDGVQQGWKNYYWKPWRAWLAARSS